MLQALRQPRWLITALVVGLLAAVFVRLGFWQLDRLEERRQQNLIGEERVAAAPVDLASLLEDVDGDLASTEYRRVSVEGVFDVAEEVLIRSQVELGQAGFHVITPISSDEHWSVLVNRGWVPLSMDQPPVAAGAPPGEVEVEGWIHLSQTKPALGPEDPPGELSVFNRVDIDRIAEQTAYPLAPVYMVLVGEESDDLPIPVDLPDFEEQGPHLAYAIQWFGFAVVGLVGFFFLLRRKGPSHRVNRDIPRG